MADNLNTYSTIRDMMDKDRNTRESGPSEIEFGGFQWNGNSLVKIYEETLSDSISDPTAKEILLDTWPEGIEYISMEERDKIKAKEDSDYMRNKLSNAEDDIYQLKKRLARFEGREGTVFLALDSLAKKITNLTKMLTPDQITKDDEIIQTRIKEIAHEIEIRTLKTLVKKQTVRVKELETQLETLKEENWKNNNIWRENYERLEEELDSTRSELHNLSFSRRGDEYAMENPLLDD